MPTKAIFKINPGIRDTDNFEHGSSGNMVGAIDLTSGRVFRVVTGVGIQPVVDPVHPVTGRKIVGFAIPCWREMLDLVIHAQKAFPGFLCPGRDVAICPDGPKLMEVNAFGDIDLSQHAYPAPFLYEQFIGLLKERQLDALVHANPQWTKRSLDNDRFGIRRHQW